MECNKTRESRFMKYPVHGGDIYRNNIRMDFSVNINPLGVDAKIKNRLNMTMDEISNYPDPEQMRLRIAIADRFQLSEDSIVCGNGASELILATVHAIRPKKIVCPVPSFYGYERAAWACSAELRCYPMKEENDFALDSGIKSYLKPDVDMLFLANPNNPVGNRIEPELLEDILDICKENDIWVLLDECFIEFLSHSRYDVRGRLKRYKNLMILRAFTKFYAIPGVRLGYLLCENDNLLTKIRLQLPEWNVSVFAENAGIAALSVEHNYANTSLYIRRERNYMETFIKRAFEESRKTIDVFDGEANFILVKTEVDLYARLLREGILIRDCSDYRGLGKGFYRIAIKEHEENEEFIRVLEKCLDD